MKYIGIDIGGTNLKAGLVDETGQLLATCKMKVAGIADPAALAWTIHVLSVDLCKDFGCELTDIFSIGVGCPGAVEIRGGSILYTCNLPLRNVPLRRLFHQLSDLPLYIENDANCAALAEYYVGGGRGSKRFITVTLGTGVGGGIIIDGKIYAGMRSMGAELGHTLLVLEGEHCTCGRDGCWEAYASATALIRQAKRAGEQHPESALHGREELTALDVFQAADAGDAAAQAVIDRWCVYVAAGMTDLVNSLAPEMILIGGGISRQGERILSPIREYVAEHCFGGREGAVPIIAAAKLGNEAGIIGAAAL